MPTPPTTTAPADPLAFARSVLDAESHAIENIPLDARFSEAIELILNHSTHTPPHPPHTGSLIVSGLGKSGLIGQKLAATFASTGTPSHFIHPVEAMHGDLGAIKRGDLVMLLSYSGNTDELVMLAEILRQDGVSIIALVSNDDCDLARLATVALLIGDVTEACPLNLAPTASTTAMLALGDALALAVSQKRKFGVDDFRKVHPGGGLGKQLLPVTAVMRFKTSTNLPLATPDMSLEQAYALTPPTHPTCPPQSSAAHKNSSASPATPLRRAGALLIVHNTGPDAGKLAGIFTDGDLRRLLFNNPTDVTHRTIGDVMIKNPRYLTDQHLVRDAAHMIREYRFDEIPILDQDQKPLGLIDVQDLITLKVIAG